MEPTAGQVIRNQKLRFAKFSQHFVEQLEDFNMSSLEHFINLNPGTPTQTARNHLGCKFNHFIVHFLTIAIISIWFVR